MVIGTLVVLRMLWDLAVVLWLIALFTGGSRRPACALGCLTTVLTVVALIPLIPLLIAYTDKVDGLPDDPAPVVTPAWAPAAPLKGP
jgi:hypothetical protein